jgi:tripartite-type tricarboxylate transporter receptor subunit TctC
MKLPRRSFLRLAAGAAALPALPRIAWAQTYPTRPVRIIVGLGAGGGSDIAARLIAQWLSERLGHQFVVENRPGAGGNIASMAVARSPADGYTLLFVSSSAAINATFYENSTFNFLRDIAPVASLFRQPLVMLIDPSVKVRDIPEFIAYAKANPGKINMASAGNGSPPHLAGELFNMMAGIKMQHVPYRSGAEMVTALLGGHAQVIFVSTSAAIEHIRTGKLTGLAVTTGIRSGALPEYQR